MTSRVPRPYLSSSISELEILFRDHGDAPEVLANLIVELAHRARPRAKLLHQKVLQALAQKVPEHRESKPNYSPDQLLSVEEHRRVAAHLRNNQSDWTPEVRNVALAFAKQHDFLANFIETRSGRLN